MNNACSLHNIFLSDLIGPLHCSQKLIQWFFSCFCHSKLTLSIIILKYAELVTMSLERERGPSVTTFGEKGGNLLSLPFKVKGGRVFWLHFFPKTFTVVWCGNFYLVLHNNFQSCTLDLGDVCYNGWTLDEMRSNWLVLDIVLYNCTQ